MIFRRKIYSQLLQWKQSSNGRTALLIEGARRVGKSTTVREFAKNEYKSYIVIDFNKTTQQVKDLFEDLNDLEYIFLYLQTAFKTTLYKRESVIVFDEVQRCPKARQAIKYLVEDGRYDYIETGSLISIRQNTKDITIPSEEDRIQMNPMDYEEFRAALGDEATIPLLKTFWDRKHPLGPAHRTAERDLRLYMLIGGMPQAVDEYIKTNNLVAVDTIKRRILNLYADDFLKIDTSGSLSKMFFAIPEFLNKNAMRYVVSSVVGKQSADRTSELVAALSDSKTVNIAYHADDPNVGMGLTRNTSRFKVFTADTGLFVTLAFWDRNFADNIIYEKLLDDRLPANLGYVYENLVAQMLVAAGCRLYYHTWPKDEKHNYEIDFLIAKGAKISPIEVKSSGYNSHKSLDEFCSKYPKRISDRCIAYTKDFKQDGRILCCPMYMIQFFAQ